jgi:hypothetical protein
MPRSRWIYFSFCLIGCLALLLCYVKLLPSLVGVKRENAKSLQPDHSLEGIYTTKENNRLFSPSESILRRSFDGGSSPAAGYSTNPRSMSGYEKSEDSYVYGQCVAHLISASRLSVLHSRVIPARARVSRADTIFQVTPPQDQVKVRAILGSHNLHLTHNTQALRRANPMHFLRHTRCLS